MAVLYTIASSRDETAEVSDDSSVIQNHIEQIDASSNELKMLEAKSVASGCSCGRGRLAALHSSTPHVCPDLTDVGLVEKLCS